MKIAKALVLFSLSFGLLFSCQKDDEDVSNNPSNNPSIPETSEVKVLLTDAPGDYKAVFIDIQDVQVNSTDSTSLTAVDLHLDIVE